MGVEIDMTGGIYRRIYSGARLGKRINSVSVDAELLFWRLHCVVDDWGNCRAEPYIVRIEAAPIRKPWTDETIEDSLRQLADAHLITLYQHDGESFLHIEDFTARQPSGRNGRRVRKVAVFPAETEGVEPEKSKGEQGSLGESGGILGNPEKSGGDAIDPCSAHTHTHTQPHTQPHTHSQKHSQTQDPEPTPEPAAPSKSLPEFAGGVGLNSFQEGVGSGGLGGRPMNSIGKELDRSDSMRKINVAHMLIAAGVESDSVRQAIYNRRDITPAIVRAVSDAIKKDPSITDPVGVLVYRLNNHGKAKRKRA